MDNNVSVNIPIHLIIFACVLLGILVGNRIMHILNFAKSCLLPFKKVGPFYSRTVTVPEAFSLASTRYLLIFQ